MGVTRTGLSVVAMLVIAGASAKLCRAQTPTQDERLWAGIVLGPSSYDLAGTGTGVVVNGGLFWQPVRGFVISPSLSYFRYEAQFERATSFLFPEVSFITSPFPGPLRPYLGVGAGWGIFLSGTGTSDPTIHALAGLRLKLSRAFAARCEIRTRSVDPFVGTTADVMCGGDIGLKY